MNMTPDRQGRKMTGLKQEAGQRANRPFFKNMTT
jgi:hypothetical protein